MKKLIGNNTSNRKKIMAIFVHIIKLINAFETFKLSPERVCVGREYHRSQRHSFPFFFFFSHVETLRPYPLELPGVLFHFHFSAYPYLYKFIILALSIKDFTLESLYYVFSQHGKKPMIRSTVPSSSSNHHIPNLSTTCSMSIRFTFFFHDFCQLCFNRDMKVEGNFIL